MKLFGKGGKFNIIDIIVVLLLIAVIVFAVVHFTGKNKEEDSETLAPENEELQEPDLRFTVFCENVPADLAENMEASVNGDPIRVDGRDIDARRLNNNREMIPARITDIRMEAGEKEGCRNVRFTVEAAAKLYKGAYQIGTQEVRLGKEYLLKTLVIEVPGIVTEMEAIGE